MENFSVVPQRIYQDTLFKAIFGREEHKSCLLSLYNALNNTCYKNVDDLELNTIENVIYVTMKNDISFLLDSQLNLYEQQSSFNPNMPLRGLMYFAQAYQKHLSKIDEDLYTSRLIKIPTPNFVVFYSGSKGMCDIEKQKLSTAFECPRSDNDFEWTATVININAGRNKTLGQKCKPLYDYIQYVNRVKTNLANGLSKENAVCEAVNFAIKNNFLNGFFKLQKAEVLNMSLTEFDQESFERRRYREGVEDGILEGALKKAEETAIKLIKMNLLSSNQIASATQLSLEDVNRLKEEIR